MTVFRDIITANKKIYGYYDWVILFSLGSLWRYNRKVNDKREKQNMNRHNIILLTVAAFADDKKRCAHLLGPHQRRIFGDTPP